MSLVEAKILLKDGNMIYTTAPNHYELFRKLTLDVLHQMREMHTMTISIKDMRQGRETNREMMK